MDLKKLFLELRPFGDVLEVGFGNSSKEIQTFHPSTHTILSTDSDAMAWAKEHAGVKVICEIWQSALPSLGVFDTIYFGIDPLEFGFLIRFHYTDHELEAFCESVIEKKYLSRFLAELEENGQITNEQKEKMIRKHRLTHQKAPLQKRSGEMIDFLKICLTMHMRKGSRFSCYLKREIEDTRFYNEILVDPFLEVRQDGLILVIEKLS